MAEMRSVSIVIPTLNCAGVLTMCLASIAEQDYPRELVEIVIADGGSVDDTLNVAKPYTDKIYPNPLQTGEAGKAVALKHAQNEIVAFIDSDNVLPSRDWLVRMVEPFADEEIVGTEPLEYTYRRGDGYITRYCALVGMNDPLCMFLGNYDRYNCITRKWTEMPVMVEDKGDYLKVTLDEKRLPTIGANGFLIRREELLRCSIQDYLFDIDVIYDLAQQGKNKYAKVKTGIIHLFSGNVLAFARKQRRRVRDYLYYSKASVRLYPWSRLNRLGLLKFILYCLLVFPLLAQALIGYLRKPDRAWFFHPIACWITLSIYAGETIAAWFQPRPYDRQRWGVDSK